MKKSLLTAFAVAVCLAGHAQLVEVESIEAVALPPGSNGQ